jgi:hypothetical protein
MYDSLGTGQSSAAGSKGAGEERWQRVTGAKADDLRTSHKFFERTALDVCLLSAIRRRERHAFQAPASLALRACLVSGHSDSKIEYRAESREI